MIETIFEYGFQALGWSVLKILTFGRYRGFERHDMLYEGALGLLAALAVGYVIYSWGQAGGGSGVACYSSPMGPVGALYENGLLRPVAPLPLRAGERVSVIVVRKADPTRWDVARLGAGPDDDVALAEAGLTEWAAALDREDRG